MHKWKCIWVCCLYTSSCLVNVLNAWMNNDGRGCTDRTFLQIYWAADRTKSCLWHILILLLSLLSAFLIWVLSKRHLCREGTEVLLTWFQKFWHEFYTMGFCFDDANWHHFSSQVDRKNITKCSFSHCLVKFNASSFSIMLICQKQYLQLYLEYNTLRNGLS